MIKVGSRVRYIREDGEERQRSGYYPPIGTLGTVTAVSPIGYRVQWDSGTNGDGNWACDKSAVMSPNDDST